MAILCRAVLAVRRVLLLRALAAVLLDRQGLLHLGLLLLTAVAAVRAAAMLLADCSTAVSVAVLLACSVMTNTCQTGARCVRVTVTWQLHSCAPGLGR
jgi:hypothetical protein